MPNHLCTHHIGTIRRFEKAANKNQPDAQSQLGLAYLADDHEVVRQDFKLASFWFSRAVAQGHAVSH